MHLTLTKIKGKGNLIAIILFLVIDYLCYRKSTYYYGNIFRICWGIHELQVDNDGVVRVGKNKYLTRDNEDLIVYLQEKGYETQFFFLNGFYREKSDEVYKHVSGRMFTSKYIVWTFEEG